MKTVTLRPESNKYLEGDLFAHSSELGWKVQKIENGNDVEFKVELPDGWTICEFSKSIQRVIDPLGNPRAAFYLGCGVQFYTRFELRQEHVYNSATGRFGEKLFFFDKKTDKIVIDFGFTDNTIELYSEDHFDLLSVAKNSMNKVYPYWENPAYYWDEE